MCAVQDVLAFIVAFALVFAIYVARQRRRRYVQLLPLHPMPDWFGPSPVQATLKTIAMLMAVDEYTMRQN
jgi:hypothetical protein